MASTKPTISWALNQKFSEESLEELVIRLNTPTEVPNPQPQSLLPELVTFAQIRAVVPDAEAFKVLSTPLWPMIADALNSKDMQSVQSNIKALIAGDCLTEKTAGVIAKLFIGKIPDPNWPETVWLSPAKAAGQLVTLEALQAEVKEQADKLLEELQKIVVEPS